MEKEMRTSIRLPESAGKIAQAVAGRVGMFLIAALLGRAGMPFGGYPLGIAWICAVQAYPLYALGGALVSAVFVGRVGWILALCTGGGMLLRYLFCRLGMHMGKQDKLFAEPVRFRIFCAALAAAFFALYRLAAGDFRTYDLIGTAFSVAVAGACAGLFSLATQKTNVALRKLQPIGLLCAFAAVVYACGDAAWFGFSPRNLLAFFGLLYAGWRYGALGGSVAGLTLGLLCKIALAPGFSLAGLLFGLLKKLHAPLAAAWAVCVCAMYVIYTQGLLVFYGLLPDLAFACGLFLLYLRFARLQNASEAKETPVTRRTELLRVQNDETTRRMQALTESLASLSGVCAGVSAHMQKPSVYRVRQGCDGSLREFCGSCPHSADCEAASPTQLVATIGSASDALSRGAAPLPPAACTRKEEWRDQLQTLYAKMLTRAQEGNKAEIFALDYAALSRLLQDAMAQSETEFLPDPEKTRAARSAAAFLGFSAGNLTVYGKRAISVAAEGVEARLSVAKETELHRVLSEICGVELTDAIYTEEDGVWMMRMRRKPILQAQFAKAGETKAGETISGDVASMFTRQDQHLFALISDGMGSGQDAAISAQICRVFLEKLLGAGGSRVLTLEMLNDFIRSRNTENFATVDLLDVDLLTGEGTFLKSGAAPSFVLRGGRLFKITSNSIPVGISKRLNAEEIAFDLEAKDVVVMFSDGIASTFEESAWLLQLLTHEWVDDLSVMAQKIILRAHLVNPHADDMTVALLRLAEAV